MYFRSRLSRILAHADMYPVGSPDGVINMSDLILILQAVLSPDPDP